MPWLSAGGRAAAAAAGVQSIADDDGYGRRWSNMSGSCGGRPGHVPIPPLQRQPQPLFGRQNGLEKGALVVPTDVLGPEQSKARGSSRGHVESLIYLAPSLAIRCKRLARLAPSW
ncbi:hypothetical protein BKA81DRAFT_380008 [Phyllosticta paracitricarpa]